MIFVAWNVAVGVTLTALSNFFIVESTPFFVSIPAVFLAGSILNTRESLWNAPIRS